MSGDDSTGQKAAFELVGGPHDGKVYFFSPGVLTVGIPHGHEMFMYLRQNDGKLHFVPHVNGKPKPPR